MNATAKKFLLFIFMLATLASSYRLMGELTLTRSREIILITRLDEMIPFVPELTAVYMTIYFMWLPLVFARGITYGHFKNAVWATFAVFALLYVFYLIMPSSYPRPLLGSCDCWRHWPLKLLYAADLPNNTFPSSHAAGVAVLLAATKNKFSGAGRFLYVVWGALILVSTFAIKQHYVLDTAAGFAAGYAIWWIFQKYSHESETP